MSEKVKPKYERERYYPPPSDDTAVIVRKKLTEKVKPEWTVIGPNGVEYEVEQAHCGICGASDAIQIRPKREADE